MRDGLYTSLSHTDYHALDRVSNSYLSRLARCPAAARIPQEETPAMALGKALHSLVLDEWDVFKRDVAVAPVLDKRSMDGKEAFAAFQRENAGKTIISQDDYLTIKAMKDAVIGHPAAGPYATAGIQEVSVLWTDASGLELKARPDCIPILEDRILVDLKKTRSASPHGFQQSIITYGYHRQAAFYLDGMTAATGEEYQSFLFIAVEDVPPYRVECYKVSEQFIRIGRDEYRRLIELELKCRQASHWPHYSSPEARMMEAPVYLVNQNNAAIAATY